MRITITHIRVQTSEKKSVLKRGSFGMYERGSMLQALQKRVEILMIPMPVVSGPTSGGSQCEEFSEWFRQSERWTIGACEVFHYFVVKRRRYNCAAAMSYGTWFVIYYGFILCSLTLTGLAGFINYALVNAKRDTIQQMAEHTGQYPLDAAANTGVMIAGFSGLAWTYIVFLIFFYLDREGCKLIYHLKMKPQGAEDTGFCQNFKDWILMWPSLVMYSCVSYWAIIKVAFYGKRVCGHDPSSKDNLRGLPLGEALTSEASTAAEASESDA